MGDGAEVQEKKLSRKRCGVLTERGPCPGYPVRNSSDQRCVFHSKDPKVRQILIEGRMKGCTMPERRERLSLRNTGVAYQKNIDDTIRYLNFLHCQFFLRKISAEDVEVSIRISGALKSCFELRDTALEIEALKDEIEQLKGDGGNGPSDEVDIKVTYDADGNEWEIREDDREK